MWEVLIVCSNKRDRGMKSGRMKMQRGKLFVKTSFSEEAKTFSQAQVSKWGKSESKTLYIAQIRPVQPQIGRM